jgi:hypothetical protein
MQNCCRPSLAKAAKCVHNEPKRLFCFGLGFLAREVCHQLAAEGWAVHGTATDVARLPPETQDIAHVFDGCTPLRCAPQLWQANVQ